MKKCLMYGMFFSCVLCASDGAMMGKILRIEDGNKVSYSREISQKEVSAGKVTVVYFKKQNSYQGSLDLYCPLGQALDVRYYETKYEKSGWKGVFLALVDQYTEQLSYEKLAKAQSID